MKVQIIAVGTELLLGDTLDTNSNYLSIKMRELGFDVYKRVVVGDNYDRLYKEIEEGLQQNDLIITTGGLGPTEDDITKKCCCDCLGKEMVLNEKSYAKLRNYFNEDEKQSKEISNNVCFQKMRLFLKTSMEQQIVQ